MQQVLKQSTAFTTIVGPILDSTGASYTGAVIGDLNITKNGTTAAMAAAATLTHDHNGHYLLVGTTGNSDTLGRLDVTLNKATYAMPPKCFEVLAAATFDTLVTNGTLASTTSGRTIVTDVNGLADANAVKVGPTGAGTAQTARDIGASVLLSTGTGTGQLDFTSGVVKANATQWLGGTIPAVNVTGVPLVDAKYLLGTIFATPATAGIPDVNAKNVNNVSAASVTTISANLGTTQPINFTGTAASALAKSDMVDIAGAAVSASTAQLGVNVVNFGGAAGTFASGRPEVNTTHWSGTILAAADTAGYPKVTVKSGTSSGEISLSGGNVTLASSQTFNMTGSITGNLIGNVTGSVASVTGAVGSITGVTFPTNFGVMSISATTGLVDITQTAADKAWSTTTRTITGGTIGTYTGNTPQTGDAYARLGAPAGASIAADIAALPAAVWAYVVENSKTALHYLRVIKAAVSGKLSGAATTSITVRDDADTKARITATVDSDGNRSAVTIDGT